MVDITEFESLEPDRVDGVGNPANGVTFLMLKSLEGEAEAEVYKRDFSAEERRKAAAAGHALSDGSYPIENTEDLKNAAGLAESGHGDVAGAKRLIARRAKELGVANPLTEHDDAEKADGGPIASDRSVSEGEAESQTHEVGDAEPAGPDPDATGAGTTTEDGHPQSESFPHGPEGDGGGDTAPDKSIPEGEALSQTNDNAEGIVKEGGGEVNGGGSTAPDKDEHEAEAESQTKDDAEGNTSKAMGGSDSDPGSPSWEHKDVALGQKAEALCMELCEVIRSFTEREKAEGGASKELRHAARAARSLLENPDQLRKAVEAMTDTNELVKALGEYDQARRAEKQARKQAKADEIAAKAAEAAKAAAGEDAHDGVDAEDAEKAEKARADEIADLKERLAKMEAEPGQRAFASAAGVHAALRGPEGASVLKSLEDRVAEAEAALKAAGDNEFMKTRALADLDQARKSLFMAKMVNRDNAVQDGHLRPGRFGQNSTNLFNDTTLTRSIENDTQVKYF